jgi:pepF/M3 family oligoendopeptidase
LADFEKAKQDVASLDAWTKENLASTENAATKIETYINKINTERTLIKLLSFAHLTRNVDDNNEPAKKYADLLRMLMAEMAGPTVLFKKFVQSIPNLNDLIDKSPLLKEHEFYLSEIVAGGKYLLSDEVEIAMAKLQTTGSSAWADMKDTLLASMQIPVTVNGVEKSLPLPAIRNLASDTDANIRKDAYFAEMASYETVNKAVACSLNAIKGEVLTVVNMRGYESPLHMTLVTSRLEKGTLDAMLSAIEDYLPTLRRFYKRKAVLLGHTKGLPFYDLTASTSSVNMKFTYQEAMDFVLEQFYTFSKKMGDLAKHAFDNNWIDVEPRVGKRGGAFCYNMHFLGQSRIMLNYSDTFGSVKTLAHELGHAYHGLCLRDTPYLKTIYTMPIAETASTFCEAIITDAAVKTATAEEKHAILEEELSAAAQILIDIYSRYLFELRYFEKRKSGSLSVEEINELMLQAQKDAYGDSLDPDCLHKYMWINKVHYYFNERNFYNFPYSYGKLFASGLYAKYLTEGDSFLEKYDDLLAATGSNSLEVVGDLAGIDVRKKDFWIDSLKLIEKKIDEFCG